MIRAQPAHFPAVQPHPSAPTDCTSHEHDLSLAWSNNSCSRPLLPRGHFLPWHSQDLVHTADISHTRRATTQMPEFIRDVTTRLLAADGVCEPVGGCRSCQDTASPISSLLPRHGCCPPGHGIAHLRPVPSLTHSGPSDPGAPGSGCGGCAGAVPAAPGSRRTPGKPNETGEPLHHLPLPPWAPASSGGCRGTAPRWGVLGRGLGGCFLIYGIGAKSKRRKRRKGGNNPAGCSHQPLPAAAWQRGQQLWGSPGAAGPQSRGRDPGRSPGRPAGQGSP